MPDLDFKLSIVVPAYNEEKRIHTILEAIEKYVKGKDFRIETLIVVDGSPDNTADVAEAYSDKIPNFRVIRGRENRGKGGAVAHGFSLAKGKYVVFSDADNSTPIEQVDKLLKYAENFDVVIGSRYCSGGKLAVPQPFYRIAGSRFLNILIQLLAVPGVKDTQCGFKLFEREAANRIFSKMSVKGWSFDIEILAIARKLGYKIKEVGITWYDNPHSAVNPIKDGLRMITDSWQVRKNIISGVYNK